MNNEIVAWLKKESMSFVEEADLGGKTLLTIFNFESHKVPASITVASIAGMEILNIETQDLFSKFNFEGLSSEAISSAFEWMLKDNDLNSLGNWGISPLGQIRFQVEIPVFDAKDISNILSASKAVIAAIGPEIEQLKKIFSASVE